MNTNARKVRSNFSYNHTRVQVSGNIFVLKVFALLNANDSDFSLDFS